MVGGLKYWRNNSWLCKVFVGDTYTPKPRYERECFMTFGNKLLQVIVVSHIQLGTLFASQALCNAFDKQLSLHIENTATECIEIEEETCEEASEQELKIKYVKNNY